MKKDVLRDSNKWRTNLKELSNKCFDSTLEIPENYRHFEESYALMGDIGLFVYEYLFDNDEKLVLDESLAKKYHIFLLHLFESPRTFNYAIICLNQGYFEASFREMRASLESIVTSIYEVDRKVIDAKYPIREGEKKYGISINLKIKNTINFILDNEDEGDKKSVAKFVNQYMKFHSKFVHSGKIKLNYTISHESGYDIDLASELHGTPSRIYKLFNVSLRGLIEMMIILTIYVYQARFLHHITTSNTRLERLKVYPNLTEFLLQRSKKNDKLYLLFKKCLDAKNNKNM